MVRQNLPHFRAGVTCLERERHAETEGRQNALPAPKGHRLPRVRGRMSRAARPAYALHSRMLEMRQMRGRMSGARD